MTLINDSTTSAQTLAVDVSGAQGAASITRLLAPSAAATSGVTIGGQSLGATGEPTGPAVDITVDLRRRRVYGATAAGERRAADGPVTRAQPRTSFLYVIRFGRSASAPSCSWRKLS